ncbi:MAG: hypothetical protein KME21_07850 [Desmonostoc vinosum HA7617-LM4]|nr:hypothetical protein [Desmonostoc vinosum HA7617-LM4]
MDFDFAQPTGNEDWGLGTGEWGMRTGDWGLGNGEFSFVILRVPASPSSPSSPASPHPPHPPQSLPIFWEHYCRCLVMGNFHNEFAAN